MPRVHHVKNFNDYQEKIKDALVVIDFTASWCGPCRMIGPEFDRLSDDYPTITFLKVDVDEVQEAASAAGVRAMPTFLFYKAGSKVKEMVGADKAKLTTMITDLVEGR